jgi:hypothetical protein
MSVKHSTGTLLPGLPPIEASPEQLPFFVTGLPRSRTGWLANFLTSQGALCVHEGLIHGVDPALRWLTRGGPNVRRGLSDSILPLYWTEVFQPFSSFRLVIVERDPEECWESLLDFLELNEVRVARVELEARFASVSAHLRDMIMFCPHVLVKFEELNEPEALLDIWEHCLPGLPYDEERTNLLQRLNVQQQVSAVKAATL